MRAAAALLFVAAMLPLPCRAACDWIDALGAADLDAVIANLHCAQSAGDRSCKNAQSTTGYEHERERRIGRLGLTAARQQSLRNGQIWMGATDEMACLAWGKPDDVNRTIVAGATREQWVYGNHSYLYFTNGRLTAIQN